MKAFNIFLYSQAIILVSCQPAAKPVESTAASSAPLAELAQNVVVNDNDNVMDNCVRGQAEPVIDEKKYAFVKFEQQPDSITAYETVRLRNGDRLVIHNWGCEYYVLTFRFETERYSASADDHTYWYKTAVEMMKTVIPDLKEPATIKRGTEALENFILQSAGKSGAQLSPGAEIDFGGEEIRDFVTFDKAEKLDAKRYALEISFFTGPL